MAVEDPENQLPVADPHLPLNDPLSEFNDPLSEFASEPLHKRERLIEFEPGWRGPDDSNGLTARALPVDFTAAPSLATGGAARNRWFFGAVMLGVGVVAGFAGGVAVVTQYGGDQNLSSLASNRVDSDLPRAEVQPPPNPPVADRPADVPIAEATNDPARTTKADAATTAPKPLVTGPRASVRPVETIPESPVGVLYVQSRPAGAEVYLNGQLVTTTPFQVSDITPGQHTIRIELQGYRTWSAPIDVEPGARVRIAAVLER